MAGTAERYVSPDLAEVFTAALLAPLGAVGVACGYSVIEGLHYHRTLLGAIGGLSVLPLAMLVIIPLSWLIIFLIGVPIVMLWWRVRRGISWLTTAIIGAAIPVAIALVLDRAALPVAIVLPSLGGAASASVFWWLALKPPA